MRKIANRSKSIKQEVVRETVRRGYAEIAVADKSCCGAATTCCGSGDSAGVAKAVGYSDAELAMLPAGANMGLSCGNPGAIAVLKPGEVVLDLGSGGGFDVFIAARKVGRTGRSIGVDMTAEMVSKARKNAEVFRKQTRLTNVEFRLGEIEHLPMADASVDVVMSNCVINLSPDKPQVWREIARVLKPGGRVAVSDLALLRPLPPAVRKSAQALVGCLAGAVLVETTRRMVRAAGLTDVELETKSGYTDKMVEQKDSMYRTIHRHLPRGRTIGDYAASLSTAARKPR